MPSFFTGRAKGEVALTDSNMKEVKDRAEVCQFLKKRNETSARQYIFPPLVVRFLGERCSSTLTD